MSLASWRVWDQEKDYGDKLYSRAIGEAPEMESSKATARVVAHHFNDNDLVLDVGCGAGHYLRSLDKLLSRPFSYHGVDATKYYVELASKAFSGKRSDLSLRRSEKFTVGDIFELPLPDHYADIVMSNNVLQHLPSIVRPINELWRVTKRCMIVRALVGKVSFRTKQVNEPEAYTPDGEPENFHYYNIYSEKYVASLIEKLPGVTSFTITPDNDFSAENFKRDTTYQQDKPHDLTTVINGMQINNYIIQPWAFVVVGKEAG